MLPLCCTYKWLEDHVFEAHVPYRSLVCRLEGMSAKGRVPIVALGLVAAAECFHGCRDSKVYEQGGNTKFRWNSLCGNVVRLHQPSMSVIFYESSIVLTLCKHIIPQCHSTIISLDLHCTSSWCVSCAGRKEPHCHILTPLTALWQSCHILAPPLSTPKMWLSIPGFLRCCCCASICFALRPVASNWISQANLCRRWHTPCRLISEPRFMEIKMQRFCCLLLLFALGWPCICIPGM